MNILESILKTLRDAAAYNQHELVAPRVILWPDEDRLWVSCIEVLRVDYPALWTLGDYQPDKAIGPAAWLRYQLETHSDLAANADVPIIYLPGVGRAAFRSAEQCPKPAKHLYALQFQGQFWTQKNGKDWTPYAFLSSSDGGLKLDVAADQDTRRAIQESLRALMEVDIEGLRGRKLEASDLRALVIHDPARTVLRWIGNPVKIKAELQRAETEWTSFCAVCRSIYHFDPERDGALIAAENLTTGKGDWVHVWMCYKDAPEAYPGVREILDKLPAKPSGFFDTGDEYHPQSNSDQESRLESALLSLVNASPKDAFETVVRLAQDHAHRVTWPWAKLGYAPLARAIIPLQELAQLAQSSGTPTTWEALAEYYANVGWKVDRSVIQAIDAAHPALAAKAVATAIRAIYIPWLERYATVAQGLAPAYPTSAPDKCRSLPVEQGTIYLFVDGLRMDLARRLEDKLHASSLNATLNHAWSALPTVTATAKPAWQALASKLRGPLEGDAFQPREKGNGKALTHPRFKQLLEELGITFVESNELALPSGCGWSEFSNFDSYGHEQGAKLAWRVEEELAGLMQRVLDLLQVGWKKVCVITDHGWLVLPGGLPKADLPKHLTGSLWGRCAMPAQGAQHGYPVTAWFWDAAEAIVLAPGIACFVANMEYAHGGLTMQEALIPSLTISSSQTNAMKVVELKSLKWKGLRADIYLEGAQGYMVDVRVKVADATTSFISSPVPCAADGQKVTLLIEDDDAISKSAVLVVIDQSGQVQYKHPIFIGENEHAT